MRRPEKGGEKLEMLGLSVFLGVSYQFPLESSILVYMGNLCQFLVKNVCFKSVF